MKDVFFVPKRKPDLDRIWDYTDETWGRAQANQYIGKIRTFIADVAADRHQVASVDHIQHGYTRGLVGRRAVFFTVREQALTVVRVLHQRMNVGDL